jgi:outer membrane receptor protein involved in Fe transport
LSAVDHLELLMDGASALYGADAVGGVVNIITRQHFPGSRIFVDAGGNPDGTQHQYRFGYIGGFDWSSSGGAVVALEDYRRQSLPAARRVLASSEIPGGPDLGIPYSNPGTLVTRLGSFAVPAGQRTTALDFTTLHAGTQNLSNAFDNADVLPRQIRDSLYASAHQNFTDAIDGVATVLWTERHVAQYQGDEQVFLAIPADTRFLSNVPTDAAPLFLQYNVGDAFGPLRSETTIRTFNAAGDLNFQLPRGWQLWSSVAKSLEQQFDSTEHAGSAAILQGAVSDPESPMPFNPFDGSHIDTNLVAAMRTQPWFGMRSQLWQFHVKAAGPLFSLPGGDVQAALGGEYRNQVLQTGSDDGGASPPIASRLRRTLRALFGEVKLPIFGAGNALPGLQKLDLSLAARYERYSDFGSSVTPRFWVIYSPIEALQIRSSYARSTRAPNLGDLREAGNVSFLEALSDPQSPQGSSQVLAWAGGNARLTPEHGISHTLGLRFLPADAPAFEAEINYFNTVFKDRIQMTGTDPVNAIVPDVLEDPQYQEIVTRAPTAALQDQICKTTLFLGGQAACQRASISAIVDLRSRNIATLSTRGLDFLANWSQQTSVGRFDYNLTGVYRFSYSEKATSRAPEEALLNTPHNPLRLNLLTDVDWHYHEWTVQLIGNYVSGYHDPANLGHPDVRSWMTYDAGVQYEFDALPFGWMNKLAVGLNVENLFNQGPPPLVNREARVGYDQENGELSGRILRGRVALEW